MSGASRVAVCGLGPAACLLALLFVSGCAASGLVRERDRYRHARHGYAIAAPGAGWSRLDVDGADLAFRGPAGETMALLAECGKPLADPAILARHLMIGLGEWRLRQAGPAAVNVGSGWTQTFDARAPGGAVRVKTVTLVEARCSYDWILVVTGDFEAVEPVFDAWRESFEPEPREVLDARGDVGAAPESSR